MDVVSLYSNGGHSPSCFWIGGYESDAENMIFTWNVSARVMDKYFIEWESGYPKNRYDIIRKCECGTFLILKHLPGMSLHFCVCLSNSEWK